MKEEWNTINDFPNYEVSNTGIVRNRKTGRILKPYSNRGGYLVVILMNSKGERKCLLVHRLVAKAFIPNPNAFPQINHKDGNKHNNFVDNLEWCTARTNIQHACKMGLRGYKKVPVAQIDNNGDIVAVFESLWEAFMITGINAGSISLVMRKKRRMAGGYNWVPVK